MPRMTSRVQITNPGLGVAWVGIGALAVIGLLAITVDTEGSGNEDKHRPSRR